ncbi:dolichyl-phosphate beta-glucosyltransferase [Malassezia sp. CBS 17886]|nr:dolichyl-phosphate beta-glucosyltransferase [Malassezia sp. CBS 17886]
MGAACCAGGGAGTLLGVADGSMLSYGMGLILEGLAFVPVSVVVPTLVAALVAPYFALRMAAPTPHTTTAAERTYTTAACAPRTLPLPALRDAAAVQLTVVVPMYNEAQRLPSMLDESVAWLEGVRAVRGALAGEPTDRAPAALTAPLTTYELLLVDDGSSDDTFDVALAYAQKRALPPGAEIRITRLHTNRGKGAAVRHGVLHARGAHILFADADGATRFADLGALAREMARMCTREGHGIVVGSRAHLVTSDAVVKRSRLRNLLMRGFHVTLRLLMRPPSLSSLGRDVAHMLPTWLTRTPAGVRTHARVTPLAVQPEIRDTQCGFKLFSRASAQLIFPRAHIDRWIFDVELLLLAEMAGRASEGEHAMRQLACGCGDVDGTKGDPLEKLPLPIGEVPVHWTEIDGSKIHLLADSLRMGRDLLVIRMSYALGRWARPPK